MRGTALLLGTCFTLAYGYVAQAAMTADRAGALRRMAAAGHSQGSNSLASPVWNGGTLTPITVVATVAPGTASEQSAAEAVRPRRPQPPPRPAHTVRLS